MGFKWHAEEGSTKKSGRTDTLSDAKTAARTAFGKRHGVSFSIWEEKDITVGGDSLVLHEECDPTLQWKDETRKRKGHRD